MKITQTELDGALICVPDYFPDDRGFFLEVYNKERYHQAGLTETFVQDNHSQSKKGVLRGLHYQLHFPQGKLLYVTTGEILDVAVDIRLNSPTFGKYISVLLSAENKKQLYVPAGFAHGFAVLSESADVIYKCTDVYHSGDDHIINYKCPMINIEWPCANPLISEKDNNALGLIDIPNSQLPTL